MLELVVHIVTIGL